jgi:HAD superfamily hydrolase (TIGR01509 family)
MGQNALSIPRGIRAILFDLGNVLIDVDFYRCARFWSDRSGLPAETLASRFRIDRAYQDFECGRLTASDYYTALRRMLGIDLPDDIMREGWNTIIKGEKTGIRDCLEKLSRHYPLYILTNTNPEHEIVWRDAHRDLLGYFEKIFVSSRMGFRKPDGEVYRQAARSIGQPYENILFFDDAEENVSGARRCGMQAVHVVDHDTIPSSLSFLAVDPDA